jgi:hypothetical protein
MTTKNFGAGVSVYLDVDGRSFETTVYQASKPVLDSELNQSQDISQSRARGILQLAQSGWLGADVLDTSSNHAGLFIPSGGSNELTLPAMQALVNGWHVLVNNTGDTDTNFDSPPGGPGDDVIAVTLNRINLGAPPAGAGALRTDLVILEVWRCLLSAAPSTVGKSHTGRIWRNGNVKIDSVDDFWLNYADDIQDANVGAETTKRVQIQYRLRVIQGVDIDAYASGIADPSVVAHSVPTSAVAPDGSVTAFPYSSRSVAGDGGLWRAGDGDPANDLGSVDGYMYALPLLAVFRRNSAAFARDTNHNGGSGRPDGLTATIIDARDVFDLRTSVSTTGWSLQELLQKNLNLVFDNALMTEQETTPLGGGSRGHTNIWADEIGPTDNAGAEQIRTGFDGVCRRFSDRPILETVTVRLEPTDQVGGDPSWSNASTITIDPSGATTPFRIYPHGNANFVNAAPTNMVILDVISWVSADTTGETSWHGHFEDPVTGTHVGSEVEFGEITGLGTAGPISLTFAYTAPIADDLYVTLLVSYPGGAETTAGGLSRTPAGDFAGDSFVLETPAQLPASAPYSFASVEGAFDYAHREVALTYRTSTVTFEQQLGSSGLQDLPANTRALYIPDRVADTPTPVVTNVTSGQTYADAITLSNDGHIVFVSTLAASWSPSGVPDTEDVISVEYEAVRPIPNNGVQFTIWYETHAPQTIRTALLGTTLRVIPRYVAAQLYVLVSGSGSLDEAYPFPQQYVQSPGVYPSSGGSFSGDHELDGLGHVSISDFNAATGFLQIPTLVPAVPSPQALTFIRDPGDVDAEGRSYFKEVPAGYIPSAFAQPLSNDKRHKNVLPMLAELAEDGPIGAKGALVLVLLSRWSPFDTRNYVGFDPDLANNFTSASVYRLKGNPLSAQRA